MHTGNNGVKNIKQIFFCLKLLFYCLSYFQNVSNLSTLFCYDSQKNGMVWEHTWNPVLKICGEKIDIH